MPETLVILLSTMANTDTEQLWAAGREPGLPWGAPGIPGTTPWGQQPTLGMLGPAHGAGCPPGSISKRLLAPQQPPGWWSPAALAMGPVLALAEDTHRVSPRREHHQPREGAAKAVSPNSLFPLSLTNESELQKQFSLGINIQVPTAKAEALNELSRGRLRRMRLPGTWFSLDFLSWQLTAN